MGVAGLARFPFDILSRNARSLGVLVIYGSFADADARAAETTGWPAAVDVCAALLAAALLLALYALYRLDASRREMLSAHGKLASLTQRLKSGESTHWRETGVADVDAIAHTLEEFDQRLRHKRAKLVELNQELIKSDGLAGSGGFDNLLRAIIDAMPVGVLVAEAPSGRILEGNRAVETILGHPVIYSEDVGAYERRPAAHENGAPLSSGEFPLARALAGEERPTLECRYQRGDGEWIWINIVGAPIRNERNEVIGAIAAITDIDDIKTAEERGRQMNLELHHRVNNALAMIQGIANITARSATSFECFRSNFNDRIHCLSRISTLLVKKSWTSTPMRELVAAALECDLSALRDRISLSGPDVDLRSEVALALGMALHELASNARRYGALSTDAGHVTIDWRVAACNARCLTLIWEERGGPAVARTQPAGIGQFLMKNVFARQFGGDIELVFEQEGVRAFISAEI